MAKLTGNIRFRQCSRITGKSIVVLQVEYRYTHVEKAGASVDVYSATAWRDAKVEDLLELDFKSCKIMNTNETQIKPLNLGTGEHDWPSDHPQYISQCVQCGEVYSGPKRSIWCYTCERKDKE